MNRRSLCAALAATGLLAAPAGALADTSVYAGPIKVKGYDVTLTATDGATDSFGVMASRRSGLTQQMHMWTFGGVAVKVKGSSATIKGSLGRYGAIDAKVAAGAKARGTVPKGCTGSAGTARKGALTGRTRLKLDTSFFRTVAPRSMKAQILTGDELDCASTLPQSGGLMLTSTADTPGGSLMVTLMQSGGKVTQQVMRTDTPSATAPASVMHLITGTTGPAGLAAAADLSTATAKAAGGFLGGTLQFAGEGMGTMASGTASGDFTARFDSIGAQALPAGTSAMLMQR